MLAHVQARFCDLNRDLYPHVRSPVPDTLVEKSKDATRALRRGAHVRGPFSRAEAGHHPGPSMPKILFWC